jgi:hypothetical protein
LIDGHPDGASIDIGTFGIGDQPGEKGRGFSRGRAISKWNKHDLIPTPVASIPGPVFRNKCTVLVNRRELKPFVESELQRRHVRAQRQIRGKRL